MPELAVDVNTLDLAENRARALRGDLFYAFAPDLLAARQRAKAACHAYNTASSSISRREQISLWRSILQDASPLPPPLPSQTADDALFDAEPWVEPPVRIDYGTNLHVGRNVYMNFNTTILDTCEVWIGDRTLIASNVAIYAATHPLDHRVRNGTRGPELGKEIHIGADCFVGGNVVICPGVRIGDGSTIGAGSVVTRDVPPLCVAAGNPARVIRRLE